MDYLVSIDKLKEKSERLSEQIKLLVLNTNTWNTFTCVQIKLWVLNPNTWNLLTVCKQNF